MKLEITRINKKKLKGDFISVSCELEELKDKINLLFPREIQNIKEGDELEIKIWR